MGVESINALPIGQGKSTDIITAAAAEKGLTSPTRSSGDNGWCLALVEPDGERTACLSVSGVEQLRYQHLIQLDLQDDAIIYLSGYQLSSGCGEEIVNWRAGVKVLSCSSILALVLVIFKTAI